MSWLVFYAQVRTSFLLNKTLLWSTQAIFLHYRSAMFRFQVVDLVVQEDEQVGDLRQQLFDIQRELKTINMVDQFAKYAKLERRMNRLKEELSKISECCGPYYLCDPGKYSRSRKKLGERISLLAWRVTFVPGASQNTDLSLAHGCARHGFRTKNSCTFLLLVWLLSHQKGYSSAVLLVCDGVVPCVCGEAGVSFAVAVAVAAGEVRRNHCSHVRERQRNAHPLLFEATGRV